MIDIKIFFLSLLTDITGIEEITAVLEAQRSALGEEDPAQEIAQLEQELLELQHRTVLAQRLTEIEEYVQRRIWAPDRR